MRHKLRFGLFSLLVDLDELDRLAKIPFFSYNKANLVSFHDEDHGPRDGSDLRVWLAGEMAAAGIRRPIGGVRMLILPRIVGYQFNPLTIWFIDDAETNRLSWILYEIHNTFGDAHSHLVAVDGDGTHRHGFAKELHVSPLFDVDGGYRVRISTPQDRFSISIEYANDEGRQMTATLGGRRRELTAGTLFATLVRYPLVTMRVMVAIHLEALKIWRKGARFRKRPAPPAENVSVHVDTIPV